MTVRLCAMPVCSRWPNVTFSAWRRAISRGRRRHADALVGAEGVSPGEGTRGRHVRVPGGLPRAARLHPGESVSRGLEAEAWWLAVTRWAKALVGGTLGPSMPPGSRFAEGDIRTCCWPVGLVREHGGDIPLGLRGRLVSCETRRVAERVTGVQGGFGMMEARSGR